jgi:Ni2+-binding GTPase involved in maturation of urease and hydrogenase
VVVAVEQIIKMVKLVDLAVVEADVQMVELVIHPLQLLRKVILVEMVLTVHLPIQLVVEVVELVEQDRTHLQLLLVEQVEQD